MDKRIYLDYAASTPVDPRVLKVMQPYFSKEFGNPGSLHSFGQAAIAAVDEAREKVASSLDVDFREIIFTGSATEANNLSLRGVIRAARAKVKNPRLIISAIEHESILETARDLEKGGVDVVYLPVNKKGIVSLSALRSALNANTVLVSVMYVNNETGAIQPIPEIAEIIRNFRERRAQSLEPRAKERKPEAQTRKYLSALRSPLYPLLHTDAAQAFSVLECAPAELGVDLMTISGQKIYGPKGAGALYIKERRAKSVELRAQSLGRKNLSALRSPLVPILTGGGQEFGLRSATENVPGIAGFGEAAKLAVLERAKNERHIKSMRELFEEGIHNVVPKAEINAEGAPHILNIWVPGYPAEDIVTRFDLLGIAVSAGSACKSRAPEPSHVLGAMGFSARRVKESIRISFGKNTTPAEVKAALAAARKVFGSN